MKKKIGLSIIAGGLFLNGLPVSANELQELAQEDIVEEVNIEETVSQLEETEVLEEVTTEEIEEETTELASESELESPQSLSGVQTRGLGDGQFNLADWQYTNGPSGAYRLQKYNGTDTDIVIPGVINDPAPTILIIESMEVLNEIPNVKTIQIDNSVSSPIMGSTNFDNAFAGNTTLEHLDLRGLQMISGNVTSANNMFSDMPNLQSVDISGWDLNGITTLDSVFKNSSSLQTINMKNVDTTSLTSFTNSFDGVVADTLDITGWNLENVSNTSNIFQNASITNVIANDIKLNQNTGIISFMHQDYTPGVNKILQLNNIDLGNRTTLTEMFLKAPYSNIEMVGWDTGNITNMAQMFRLAEHLGDLDLSHFDMKNVNSASQMFQQAIMGDLNIDNWELYNMSFVGGTSGVLSSGKFANIDMSNWKLRNNASLYQMFVFATTEGKVTFKNLDITPGTTVSGAFNQLNASELDVSGWTNTDRITSLDSLFSNSKNLKYVDLSDWDTSNVTNTKWVFSFAEIDFVDISNWDLKAVTIELPDVFSGGQIKGMNASNIKLPSTWVKSNWFYSMTSLEKLIFNDYEPEQYEQIIYFFANSSIKELEVRNMDLSQHYSIEGMFSNMPNLEKLDLTGLDVSNISNFSSVFKNSKNLKEVDLTGWDTGNMIYAMDMFKGTESLEKLDVNHFDTTNLENTGAMFEGAKSLKQLDLSNWDTTELESIWSMFEGTDNLTMIDLTGWDTSNIPLANADNTFKTANPTPLTVFASDNFFINYDYAGDNRTPEFLGLQKNARAGEFSNGDVKQELTYKVNDFVMNQRIIPQATYNAFTAEEPTPTTAGDYFSGWDNTNLNVTQDYDLFDGSQIFNANYRNTYPVVFHDIAGDINLVGTYGTVLTGVPSPTVKPNHGFVEWNTQADGLGTSFDPTSDTVPGALELYPIYKLNEYSVKVNINGVITTIHVNHGGLIDVNDLPQIVDKEGYTFVGWNTQADGLGLNFNPLSDPVTADLEIYPIYKINVYKIEINIDGVITTINADYGTKLKEADLPVPPKKEGYTFVGWQVLSGRSVDMFDFDNDVIKSNLVLAPYYTKDKDPVTPPVTPPVKPTDPTKPTESKGGVNTGIEMNAQSTMITLLTSLGLVGLVATLQKKRQKQEK